MKKLLTVLIALSMVASGFAAEPLADLNTVDFSGEASVTFGVDVDTHDTGFKNETDVELIINILPGDMSKSTEGSGVWGELVVKVDGDTNLKSEEAGVPVALSADDVIVDVAKIHIGDVYVGIKSGDFDFGDSFLFPNALNYDNGDSENYGMVRNYSKETGYNQGFVVGYGADMFSVEASLRTRANATTVNKDSVESVDFYTASGEEEAAPTVQYFAINADLTRGTEVMAKDLDKDEVVYRVTYNYDDIAYWTNDYAAGIYAEVTPIQDLRIGFGGSYILSGDEVNSYGEKDFQLFTGADYVLSLTEATSVVPAVTYNFGNNYNDAKDEYSIARNELGLGLAYRWGPSEDAQSLLDDFYGDDALVYMKNGGDEDDTNLLPGVSVWTMLDFVKFSAAGPVKSTYNSAFEADGKIETYLPIMVNAYSGNIAADPGLKAYGLFYMNIAPEAGTAAYLATQQKEATFVAGGEPVQIGFAASYDLGVGDMTITPKVGALVNISAYDNSAVKKAGDAEYSFSSTTFMPEVAVDVAGVLDNTTFSVAWANASYTTSKTKNGTTETESKLSENGEYTIKAKIAL